MTASAVITADIVNSTKLSRADGKKLMKNLLLAMEGQKYEFYRGDSFQLYVKSPADALWLLLQLRTIAMKATEGSMPLADIRASVGIGLVRLPLKSLKTATDEAFVLSGRAFDTMRTGERLVIVTNEKNQTLHLGLKITAQFFDYLFQRLTTKQSAVVHELLMKRTQTETARRLKKSQATVHKHAQAAGWPDIERLLENFTLLTQSTAQANG